MRKRLIFRAALLGLMLLLPAAARAADAQNSNSGKPALILRFAALEQLRADFLYLAKLVGQEEKATQFDKMIESQIGDKKLQGIDLKKPIGAYGWVGAQGIDSSLVLLVPVADQKAFLGLLENFDIKPEKGDDGVYSASVEKVPARVYFRFANGYVYVTARDKEVLDKDKLLAPAVALPAGQVGMLSLLVNIDRIPNEIKDLALGGLDLQLANAKEKDVPNETETQKKFRKAAIDEVGKAIKSLLGEGGETSLRLDLDRKAGDVTLTASVEGKAGSAMATTIRDLGQVKSITAGLLKKDAAMNGELNVSLPEKLRELLGPVLKDGEKQALAKAKDEGEREVLNTVFEAIMPTLKAAELDVAFNLQGPGSDGLYALVSGVKVKDGAKLEKTFRETLAKDPKADVKFDVEKVGSVGIHRVTLKKVDADVRRAFGDNPLYLAFRDNALLFAAGAKGLGTLKEALAVAPTTGKVMELQVAVARLAPLAEDKDAPEIARKVFGDDKDSDRLRVTLEGGKALKLRLSMKAKLIEYANQIGQAKKK
ncbi:MAG TPA: hypothetical protein VH643_18570 [Gemmataceae bacterium]|jgi:hypothetical protein